MSCGIRGALVSSFLALCLAGCDGGAANNQGGGGDSPTGSGGSGAAGTGGDAGGGSAPGCTFEMVETYDGSAHDANAAAPLAAKAQFFALVDLMRSAEADLAVVPTIEALTAAYAEGTPSLKALTTPYHDGIVEAHLAAFAEAAGNEWTPSITPTGPGGKYGSYIFTSQGTDLRQGIEKAMFTATFYNEATKVLAGTRDQKAIDALLALYGAHPSFPANSDAVDPETNPSPDRLAAQYAERRSPKDPADPSKPLDPSKPGPYFRIKEAFVRAQLAVAAGPDCDGVRDAALSEIVTEWEKVLFSTVVFYLNDAALKLTKDPATDADLAAGLHGYGEVVGFIHGYRTLPADARTITDAEIDDLLAGINAPVSGEPTSYLFVTDPAAEVPKLLSAIDKIGSIYGFSAEDLESFKVSY